MLKLFRGIMGEEKNKEVSTFKEEVSTFKEVAYNSRTKKTLVRDGDRFIVVSGTDKAFLDTLRQLRYVKFDDMEEAIRFFKENRKESKDSKDS